MIEIDELENRCANGLMAAAGCLPIMTLASYRAQEAMARPKSSVRAVSWGFISSVALGAIWAATPWAKEEPTERDEAEVLKAYQPKIVMSIANEIGDDIKETANDYAYKIADEAGKKRMRAERFESVLWGDRFKREHIEALHDSERRKDLKERLMRIDPVYGERLFSSYDEAAARYYDLPEWRWMDNIDDRDKDRDRGGSSYYRNPYLTSGKEDTSRPASKSVFSYRAPTLEKKIDASKKAADERKAAAAAPTRRYDTSRFSGDDDDDAPVLIRETSHADVVDRLLAGGIDTDFEDES